MSEVRALNRPCRLLTTDNRQSCPVGYWGGTPQVPIPKEEITSNSLYDGLEREPAKRESCYHVVTIDLGAVPDELYPLEGVLSVFGGEEECRCIVVHDPEARLSIPEDGEALFARDGESIAPDFVVLQRGSEALNQWIRELDWSPDRGFNNFPEPEVTEAYFDYAWWEGETSNPFVFYQPQVDCVAQLGGWPASQELVGQPYPGDQNFQMVLFTYRDAEPWFEVNYDGDSFYSDARIT